MELQSNTFSQNNPKIDKVMNTYSSSPQIRLTWVNEMLGTKIDDTLFKKFCEGILQTTKLYKDAQFIIEHFSKCLITSNEMPNFRVDTGMARRIKAHTHLSKFTENEAEVDPSKNIYLVDQDFIDTMNNNEMLNAWFDILAEKCKMYLSGEKNVFTANFADTKSDIISGNDYFQDFIDSELIITNEDADRISKDSMRKQFLKMYSDKHLTSVQVMTSLRDKKISYSHKYRHNNVQGCYVGVKLKMHMDDDEDLFDTKIDASDQSIDGIKLSQDENKILQDEIAELKATIAAFAKQKKTKTKSKFTKKVIIIEDDDEIVKPKSNSTKKVTRLDISQDDMMDDVEQESKVIQDDYDEV